MSTHEPEYGYPCRLYAISPPQIEPDIFANILADAFEGGDVGAFQLRLKDTADADIYKAARTLLPVCKEHDVAFILNDRPDIAFEVGADGVHLGQEDMGIKQAREIVGSDSVIGISCHDSSHMAMEAGEMGADYVAFGAFYETASKSPEALAKYGTPKPDVLEWWATYTVVPSVAIGGITPQNCAPLVEAGADFVAAITAIWNHADSPRKAVEEFNLAIRNALKNRKPGSEHEAA